jgi:hypothetical protein
MRSGNRFVRSNLPENPRLGNCKRKNRPPENPCGIDVSEIPQKLARGLKRQSTFNESQRIQPARSHTITGVRRASYTPDYAQSVYFSLSCSNSNCSVRDSRGHFSDIAISSMARRAAWRRSERRRRKQRQRRAPRRPSGKRRSRHLLLHSLRLRLTSMTASHGPAAVEAVMRYAIASTAPASADDRGRRRDRGSSIIGFAFRKESRRCIAQGGSIPSLAVAGSSTVCHGLVPQASHRRPRFAFADKLISSPGDARAARRGGDFRLRDSSSRRA